MSLPNPPTVRIGDIFTDAELRAATALYKKRDSLVGGFAARCKAEIVTPEVLARINDKTGQQNDALYLAYMLEYAISTAQK